MKHNNDKGWIWPPAHQWFEIWGLLIIAGVAILTSEVLEFLGGLTRTAWIGCYFLGLGTATAGSALIFYAKLPLYRRGCFLTYGSRAVPEQRRRYYGWGYLWVALGILAVLLCLLSKPSYW